MKRLGLFIAALFAVSLAAMAQPHVTIKQIGADNKATTRQSSNENWALIVQDYGHSVANEATIEQCCKYAWYNTAEIFQGGELNKAKVSQAIGSWNKAVVMQGGEENFSDVLQGGGNFNMAVVEQWGTKNMVNFKQWGTMLTANIEQNGFKNFVKLIHGGLGGVVDIDQCGEFNEVFGYNNPIGSYDYAYFAGANLDVDQLGMFNKLKLYSNTPGGTVSVLQDGCNNLATVLQTTNNTGCCFGVIIPPPPACCPCPQ